MHNKGAVYVAVRAFMCLCVTLLLVVVCPLCAGAVDAAADGVNSAAANSAAGNNAADSDSASANNSAAADSDSASANNAAGGAGAESESSSATAESANNGAATKAAAGSAGAESANNVLEGDERNYVDERQIPNGSFLYETSIETLASADVFYDNATVVVTGEVVGDRRRGLVGTNSSWITLYSLPTNTAEHYAPVSVEVYVSDSLTEIIDSYGAYNTKGTYAQINGTFHLACSEHEGISDIHADSLSIVEKGEQYAQAPQWWAFVPGVIAVLAGALVVLANRVLVNRSR